MGETPVTLPGGVTILEVPRPIIVDVDRIGDNFNIVRIILTDDTNLAAMYDAAEYPIYVVIDKDGNIAATQHGAAGEGALRALLATAGIASKDEAVPK